MKLKYGMIGGGVGSLIGGMHRDAADATGRYELVCGCFSSDASRTQETGRLLGLDASRVYRSWEEMLDAETELDAVVIVTPNHVHFGPAQKALNRGIHVIVDKPMAFSLDESVELKNLVSGSNLVLAVTYTYAGYAIVGQMRELVASGALGNISKVYVEYLQGWMSEHADPDYKRHAGWRMDPAKSGISCAAADIGVHAFHLAEHVTGHKVTDVCAMLNSVVGSHVLDDDASALIRFDNGASGTLVASQVVTGEGNHLRLRVYGDLAGLEWSRSNPDVAIIKYPDMSVKYLYRGMIMDSDPTASIENQETVKDAFTSIYTRVADAIGAYKNGNYDSKSEVGFPGVTDGHRGMQFIEAMVLSSTRNSAWCEIEKPTPESFFNVGSALRGARKR